MLAYLGASTCPPSRAWFPFSSGLVSHDLIIAEWFYISLHMCTMTLTLSFSSVTCSAVYPMQVFQEFTVSYEICLIGPHRLKDHLSGFTLVEGRMPNLSSISPNKIYRWQNSQQNGSQIIRNLYVSHQSLVHTIPNMYYCINSTFTWFRDLLSNNWTVWLVFMLKNRWSSEKTEGPNSQVTLSVTWPSWWGSVASDQWCVPLA